MEDEFRVTKFLRRMRMSLKIEQSIWDENYEKRKKMRKVKIRFTMDDGEGFSESSC